MILRLLKMAIQCRQSLETIAFSTQVSFFHGQASTGKSSIARMIDFCLGGELENTPAVRKEVISVKLEAIVGSTHCVFERDLLDGGHVRVSWTDGTGDYHLQVPLAAAKLPVFGDDVFNLSDLLFHFFDVTPIKVRKNKSDKASPMIRMSFRDIMVYCYLSQEKLDNSFFRLKEIVVSSKSRDVMKFVVGLYNERIQVLETRLGEMSRSHQQKLETIVQMRRALDVLGYRTEQQIVEEASEALDQIRELEGKNAAVRDDYKADTHFVDTLRDELRRMSDEIDKEEQISSELTKRTDNYTSLKAELTTARVKLARKESASSILQRVEFLSCPLCGSTVDPPSQIEDAACPLCKSDPALQPMATNGVDEQTKRDIEARINELDESLDRSRRALRRQLQFVVQLRRQKADKDRMLVAELQNYDSAFVADMRELDRQIATLKERIRNLVRIRAIPDEIERINLEIDQTVAEIERLRRDIDQERDNLKTCDETIGDIESAFLGALRSVNVPGVDDSDKVSIDRNSWIPLILEKGEEENAWSFFDTGSGAKKTLLTECYALAVHQVAARRSLALPTLLIIDSPMKNIDDEVDAAIFRAFYAYLYGLVEKELSICQIIIIENEFVPPPEGVDVVERLFTRDDPANPPLISYYTGP